jgi:hypothetical protein
LPHLFDIRYKAIYERAKVCSLFGPLLKVRVLYLLRVIKRCGGFLLKLATHIEKASMDPEDLVSHRVLLATSLPFIL